MTDRPAGKLVSADDYAKSYVADYGFESVCALARQRRNLDFFREHGPRSILEVGCGPFLLAAMDGARDLEFRSWTIVEPAADFIAGAQNATEGDTRFHLIAGYLESVLPAVRECEPSGFDVALVSGLVNETQYPLDLLRSVISVVRAGGKILVSVPNASSFHRLLAVECGLISSPHTLSEIDIRLGHPAVFDRRSLTALMEDAGLANLTFDGYLFKPFTNSQMQSIVEMFGEHLIDGLISLGRRFPEQAAEICMTGTRR